jgi:hypothetical protein
MRPHESSKSLGQSTNQRLLNFFICSERLSSQPVQHAPGCNSAAEVSFANPAHTPSVRAAARSRRRHPALDESCAASLPPLPPLLPLVCITQPCSSLVWVAVTRSCREAWAGVDCGLLLRIVRYSDSHRIFSPGSRLPQ